MFYITRKSQQMLFLIFGGLLALLHTYECILNNFNKWTKSILKNKNTVDIVF